MKQGVRIIAGKYRGKNIPVPLVDGLRPTPQRVRETLFNWLMQDIRGARVCDAFAGSGALGFEAYSRGAKHVTLLERSTIAAQSLHKIADTFNSAQITIIHCDTIAYFSKTALQFDLIFLDPPFSQSLYEPCLNLIKTRDILAPNGLVYVESPSPLTLSTEYWTCLRQKKAGDVVYALFQKYNKPAP